MFGSMRSLLRGSLVAATCVALICGVMSVSERALPAAEGDAAEPAPPEGQTYVGSKECASCHFKQFMTYVKTGHAKAFKLLPESYQKNEECLRCHTTGFGEPSGFKDIESTPGLAGTACEACHGPGSKHVETAKSFGKEKLTADQETEVRNAIWKIQPGNVCIKCHMVQGHHPSATPKELRKK